MKTVILQSFILPQYKHYLEELPSNKLGVNLITIVIDKPQWTTFHTLKPGDLYGHQIVSGKSYKVVNHDEIDHLKSDKITILYSVENLIGEEKLIKIKTSFHGEFPNEEFETQLDGILPINWAKVDFTGNARKVTKYKWS